MNAMYAAGYSTRQIAAKFDRSPATAWAKIDPAIIRPNLVTITDEMRERALALFDEGWLVRDIEADLGIGRGHLRDVLPDREASQRRRWQRAEAQRLFDAGESYTAIAKAVGQSDRVVRGWLPTRDDHEARSARHVKPTREVTPGVNDLATLYPDVAAQWHPNLNGDLTPEHVSYGERRDVWWRCDERHEWQARINTRTSEGKGCRKCAYARQFPNIFAFTRTLEHLLGDRAPDGVEFSPMLRVRWVPKKPGMAAVVTVFAVVNSPTGPKRVVFEYDTCSTTGGTQAASALRRTSAVLDQDAADLVVRVRVGLRTPLPDTDPRHVQTIAAYRETPEESAARVVEALRAAL